ncbi:uncharacterized protein [Chironomus tepperi]|uniref:uncharacterized protein n=1 Tax=Chironomus tepperi TaxID=113505 RepID=UPI00391F9FF3
MKQFIFAIILTIFAASSDARVISKRQIGQPNFGFGQPGFGFGQPQGQNVFFPGQFPGQFQGQGQFPNQQWQGRPQQGQQGQFPQQGQQGQFPQQGQQVQFPQQGQQGQFPQQGQQGQFQNQQGQQGQVQQQSTTLAPQVLSCIERCIDTTLSNYNPVCGSDNQTYHNQERFDCANECGANLRKTQNGACPSRNATTVRPT